RGFIDNGFDSILRAYLPVEFHGGTMQVRILQTLSGPVKTNPMRSVVPEGLGLFSPPAALSLAHVG
ncbi:MAG: hypothetical protein AB2653_17000, partial [Candidatus Thiodiazotropha endolucinida]